MAIAAQLRDRTISVGFDNRTSNIMLEKGLVAGLLSGGCNVSLLGLVPLPVLAFGTREMETKAGVMITASHNPQNDNGFKIFVVAGVEYGSDHLLSPSI